MRMNIIRKYIQNILCLASIGFVAVDQSTQAVEYLITTTAGTSTNSGTLAQDLNYGQFDTPQANQTYYIRLSYTTAEAETWDMIGTGNFRISIGDNTFGYVENVVVLDPDGNWTTTSVNTIQARQDYTAEMENPNGWIPDKSPPPTTVHYLTLGRFDLTDIATGTPGTTQISAVLTQGWITLGPDITPTAAGFNINVVPEPSTMVTAALACAALGAVAAKKRKRQAVTA